MASMETPYSEEYILRVLEQSKTVPELKDYKLCYVTNAKNVDYVKRQIDSAVNFSKMGIKPEDYTKTAIFRYDGQSYLFYFIKKDEVDAQNSDPYKTIKTIAKFNTWIEYNIATGGYNSRRQSTGKLEKEYLDMVNHIVFVDSNEVLQKMNKIPIAQGTLKDSEIDKKTFMKCFITARQKNSSLVNLVRKTDGNNFYVYMEVTPAFADAWKLKRASNTRISYSKFVDELINSVRLDLDQVKNACDSYKLLNADGSIMGQVTKERQAYISKTNTSSFCLIGDCHFNREYLLNDYEKLFAFGNAYPIDTLLFLPSMSATQNLISICQKQQAQLSESGNIDEDTERFFNELKAEDPALSLYKLTSTKVNALTGEERRKYRSGSMGTYADKMYYSGVQEKLELYSRMYELRKRMNYRDPKQNNKLIPMKNAWDLGYQNIERQRMEKAFGEFGRDLYDRYYYLKFLEYLLETYKPTGALFDLTPLTSMFDIPENEIKRIEKSSASLADKEFAVGFAKYASLDDYIALLQRFDGVINVERTIKEGGRKVDLPSTYKTGVKRYIDRKIKDIVTNWKMCENGTSFNERGYVGNGIILFTSGERKALMRKMIDKSNTVRKTDDLDADAIGVE